MLNYLDYLFIYGIKQDFYVNHSYKYRTLFSSILSIFSLTLILFYIIFFGRNIFSYKNPILNQVELNYNIPNKINLSESNFFLHLHYSIIIIEIILIQVFMK